MTPVRVFKGSDAYVYVEHSPQEDPVWVVLTMMIVTNDRFVHWTRAPRAFQMKYMKELQEL